MNDLISRQAVLKGISLSCTGQSDVIKAEAALVRCVKKIPSAEPERKKPDHGYMWICPECGLEVHSDFARCVRCGWDRPSAEPEWKRGKWLKGDEMPDYPRVPYKSWKTYCSECRSQLLFLSETDFCPNCGAEMRGGEDETC